MPPPAPARLLPAALAALALLALAALVLFLAAAPRRREGFAAPRAQALCGAARASFAAGDFSYTGFLARAGAGADADAADHAAARRLWRQGALTPEALEASGA